MLDGVVGEVFHQHTLVAAKEGTRAQQQLIHLAPVDENFAVGIQRNTRQLADEVVEHGTFGHLEGRSIINKRITTIEHFNLRGCHRYFM